MLNLKRKTNKEFYVDGSAFMNKNNKHKFTFKILKIVALIVVITLFIVGSIWDRQIAKTIGDLNDNGPVSWLSLFWDKLAYTMTVPFMFAGFGILLESLNVKYKAKFKFLGIIIIIVYALFIILFTLIISRMIYQQSTFTAFGGKGRDYWFGLDGTNTIIVMTMQLSIEVILMCGIAWFLRVKFAKRADLLTSNYWIDALKIFTVFALFGVTFDPVLKTFCGRPYWVHVDYQYVIDHLPSNWTNKPTNIVNAEYLDWWQIQGFKSEYWDYLLGKGGEGTHFWSDKAFPSGHMNSSSMPVYGFLLYFMNEKRKQNIVCWKWLVFGFFIADVMMMGFMQIVSRTHYLTDLMFSLIVLLTFFKGVTYVVDHVIYKVLSFIWNKQNKTYNMFELNDGKITTLFIKINDVLWIVAKVRTAKIAKSKKYKYWHRDNIIYKNKNFKFNINYTKKYLFICWYTNYTMTYLFL
ncbi:phosphatase PAP2 family protein [Spiroplasma sp. SV19]|uniref:phosphatase PAP2 family protein n=1 Tax=Spiroplasma sp. SV19 TaxID=2570468 RepID=UPI0024B67401|nr:phosphatase PAP2 family protein [Spiroplasma sp. SV19]WHQ37508.1 phosphatase PAP2 family protein [Spiroplasma sp. SV19]